METIIMGSGFIGFRRNGKEHACYYDGDYDKDPFLLS